MKQTDRPIFLLRLRAEPSPISAIHRLRRLLKYALRRLHLRVLDVREDKSEG